MPYRCTANPSAERGASIISNPRPEAMMPGAMRPAGGGMTAIGATVGRPHHCCGDRYSARLDPGGVPSQAATARYRLVCRINGRRGIRVSTGRSLRTAPQ